MTADASRQASNPASQWARPHPLRILLVEDNDDLRQLMSWKLRKSGNEVVECADGAAAYAIAQHWTPDVGLFDVGLPGMDGWQLAHALRRNKHTTKVFLVAMSGYGAPQDCARASEAGFDRYLVKPVAWADLQHVLDGVCCFSSKCP